MRHQAVATSIVIVCALACALAGCARHARQTKPTTEPIAGASSAGVAAASVTERVAGR
jgi:hypothetical protein